jgi:hypothetical protein
MANINCLTHFGTGNSASFDSGVEFKCEGKVDDEKRKNDFGMRAIRYGSFDIATESIGSVSADHFNPKTFTC